MKKRAQKSTEDLFEIQQKRVKTMQKNLEERKRPQEVKRTRQLTLLEARK